MKKYFLAGIAVGLVFGYLTRRTQMARTHDLTSFEQVGEVAQSLHDRIIMLERRGVIDPQLVNQLQGDIQALHNLGDLGQVENRLNAIEHRLTQVEQQLAQAFRPGRVTIEWETPAP